MTLHPIFAQVLDSHARVTEVVTPAADSPAPDSHRGWVITWDYGYYTATSPDYDASWEGEEDGWVDNGQRVTARTRDGVISEVDNWFEENAAPRERSNHAGRE